MNIDDYILAALIMEIHYKAGNVRRGYMSRAETSSYLEQLTSVKLPYGSIDTAISKLSEVRVIKTIEDELAGDFYSIDQEATTELYVSAREQPSSLIYKYANVGEPLLARALERFEQLELPRTDAYLYSSVPASDRLVRLDDNSLPLDEILNQVSAVEAAVRGSNSTEPTFVDARERVLVELAVGKDLLSAPSVRLKALWAVLGGALAYIATQFAGAVMGELASQLLDLLKASFGF